MDTLDFGIQSTSQTPKAIEDFFSDAPLTTIVPLEKKDEKVIEKKEETKTEIAPATIVDAFFSNKASDVKKKEEDAVPPNKLETEEPEELEEPEGGGGDGEDGAGPKSSKFEILSKELYKLNVFSTDEDDDGNETMSIAKTGEEFRELFQKQKQKGATEWLENFLTSKHGDEGLKTFEAIYVKGVDPKEFFQSFSALHSLESLDLTDEESQEIVIREKYKREGYSPEQINKRVQKLKDFGDLEEDSKLAHSMIVTEDRKVIAQKEVDAQNKLALEAKNDGEYQQAVSRTIQEAVKKKELDGFPVNDKTAREAYDFLTTKKYKTPDGKLLTEWDKWVMETKRPENLSIRIKAALLAMNNFDVTGISKRAISKESTELFSELVEKKSKNKQHAQKAPTNGWNL